VTYHSFGKTVLKEHNLMRVRGVEDVTDDESAEPLRCKRDKKKDEPLSLTGVSTRPSWKRMSS
jgi:hypothetical protein